MKIGNFIEKERYWGGGRDRFRYRVGDRVKRREVKHEKTIHRMSMRV
jgi:hypothetical protein